MKRSKKKRRQESTSLSCRIAKKEREREQSLMGNTGMPTTQKEDSENSQSVADTLPVAASSRNAEVKNETETNR
jgi:hypothetical protein